MRKTVIAAVTALSLAGAAGGAAVAFGQTMSPPPGNGPALNAPAPPGPGRDGRPLAWMHRMWRMRMQNRPFAPGTFALFDRRVDRELSPQDVQVIAQAILLWNGNHTWQVSGIQPGPNDTIQFAYTAQDGTPIARFAINVHTGRIIRTG